MPRTPLVLAAVTAVAAIAVTTTLGWGQQRPTDAPARTEPTETSPLPATDPPPPRPTRTPFRATGHGEWLHAVPADLSVSAGLPAADGDIERVSEPVTWPFCGREAFPVHEALDARRDGATGPEYGDRRDLRVFRDDRAAHGFLRAAADSVESCLRERHGTTLWIHSVAGVADVGEEAVRLVQTYETDGMVNAGATWWNVVRVGNAVLVTATGGEYLPGETLGQGIREHDRLLGPIVDSMCVFAVAGCGAAHDIPDGFPLAAGWPAESQVEPGGDFGLTGPDRSLPSLSWNLCDRSFTGTGYVDRLRADWSNVEDYRARELVTFPHADAATAFVSSFVDYWRDCDRYASGAGFKSVQTLRPTGVGGQSHALISWSEYDDAPAIGLTVVHVIRLGHAVLIDHTSNEGNEASVAGQLDSQVTSTVPVADAMCRFTQAGC